MSPIATVTLRLGSDTEALASADAFAESLTDSVIERDRSGALPVAELARLDASGLLAITVPAADGGPTSRWSR
jgi:hypothetical protein